jgi:hypothetical protein
VEAKRAAEAAIKAEKARLVQEAYIGAYFEQLGHPASPEPVRAKGAEIS